MKRFLIIITVMLASGVIAYFLTPMARDFVEAKAPKAMRSGAEEFSQFGACIPVQGGRWFGRNGAEISIASLTNVDATSGGKSIDWSKFLANRYGFKIYPGKCRPHRVSRHGKLPLSERPSHLVKDISKVNKDHPYFGKLKQGDVFIDDIVMVDQGQLPWCAVATGVRMLAAYGIEIDMQELASMMHATENIPPTLGVWWSQMNGLVGDKGLEVKIAENTPATETFMEQLGEYNASAEKIGESELETGKYRGANSVDWQGFFSDQKLDVLQNMVGADEQKGASFAENVIGRIDESDPLAWCVVTGHFDEPTDGSVAEPTTGEDKVSHMRMIIGYNQERDEILYTDSWGEGHELKRISANDALSITKGLMYLTDTENQ